MTYRILTISKPYVAAAYRQKLMALSLMDGVEVGLVCPEQWDSQVFEDDIAADKKYWIRRLPISFNGKNHFHFYHELRSAIEQFKPDIVSLEEEHYSLVTMQAALICNRLKVPYVFYTWQNIFKNYPPPFSWFERYVFASCSGAIVGNSEAADVLRKKGYTKSIREIPQMGVSWEKYNVDCFAGGKDEAIRSSRMKLHIPQDKVIVGYVGRLVEEKGVQDLVEAVALLGPEHRQKVKILILGNGPYKDQLDSMISTMGLKEWFDFRSFVPSSEVASYMHSLNALCLPSRTRPNWKEQFGRVLVEAMAAESLVIGSSSGEIPRVIGEDGIVFEENNPQSLKQALLLCIDDHDLTKRLTSNAKRKAKLKYTHEAIASEFFGYFKEILGQRSLN